MALALGPAIRLTSQQGSKLVSLRAIVSLLGFARFSLVSTVLRRVE